MNREHTRRVGCKSNADTLVVTGKNLQRRTQNYDLLSSGFRGGPREIRPTPDSAGKENYRSDTVNSNTVNSKFHLIRSFFEIFARFLSFHVYNAWLIRTQLIQSSTNLK